MYATNMKTIILVSLVFIFTKLTFIICIQSNKLKKVNMIVTTISLNRN